ncbi:MAG TPA: MBOAT family O-acyltransferase [Nannocystaceae bacterium]|nr:MBOAT family O-acyltransferase [Nannocystaceae bacterium]
MFFGEPIDIAIARIVGALVLVAAVAAWSWLPIRRNHASPLPGMALALLLPFTIPSAWLWPRIVATVLGITLAGKQWALARSGPLDPRMTQTLPRFLFWLLMPPESRAAIEPGAQKAVRSRGLRRIARGVVKLAPIGALMWLHVALPRLHDNPWTESLWALWLCWLAMSSLTDVASGLGMLLTGLDVAETFDAPPLARSPRDFWARRWNLYVAHWLARHAFAQVGGRRHPLRATAIVFLGSGLFHEAFMFGCLGRFGPHTGFMLAFFALHGVSVMLEMAVTRRRKRLVPRPLAIALHFAWLLATAPLFFAPLGDLFG